MPDSPPSDKYTAAKQTGDWVDGFMHRLVTVMMAANAWSSFVHEPVRE